MKTSIKVKTHFNTKPYKGQTFIMPSKTIQGETLTIQQLFKRAADSGNFELDEKREPIYMDVENIEDIDGMYRQGHDLTDIQAHAERLAELNKKVQQKVQQKAKEAQKASKDAEIEAKAQALNDEQNDENAKTEATK